MLIQLNLLGLEHDRHWILLQRNRARRQHLNRLTQLKWLPMDLVDGVIRPDARQLHGLADLGNLVVLGNRCQKQGRILHLRHSLPVLVQYSRFAQLGRCRLEQRFRAKVGRLWQYFGQSGSGKLLDGFQTHLDWRSILIVLLIKFLTAMEIHICGETWHILLKTCRKWQVFRSETLLIHAAINFIMLRKRSKYTAIRSIGRTEMF